MSSACDLSLECISVIIMQVDPRSISATKASSRVWFSSRSFISTHLVQSQYSSIVSSMDSDLEAFSHYPADGSFAALAFQPAANTNYLNEGFLSY